MQTFIDMASEWNPSAKGKENGICQKSSVHLARRYKRWRKNSSKGEAINAPESRQLLNALDHVPLNVNAEINDLMQPGDNPSSNLDYDMVAGNNDTSPCTYTGQLMSIQSKRSEVTKNVEGALIQHAKADTLEYVKYTTHKEGNLQHNFQENVWHMCATELQRDKQQKKVPSLQGDQT